MRWPWRLKQGKFCSHSFYSPSLVSIAANICVFSSMCLLLMHASPGVHSDRPFWTEPPDPGTEGRPSRRPKQADHRGL